MNTRKTLIQLHFNCEFTFIHWTMSCFSLKDVSHERRAETIDTTKLQKSRSRVSLCRFDPKMLKFAFIYQKHSLTGPHDYSEQHLTYHLRAIKSCLFLLFQVHLRVSSLTLGLWMWQCWVRREDVKKTFIHKCNQQRFCVTSVVCQKGTREEKVP